MAKHQPNILFLLTDYHRFDALGCHGAPTCRTPAIDEIASTGMRFTNAYTPTALCSPARGSLLTGLYPHHHGQLANTTDFNSVFDTQILDKTGYPELMRDAGYDVSYVGKWDLPREGDTEHWGFNQWHSYKDWLDGLRGEGSDHDFARDEVQRLEWGPGAPFCGRSTLPADKMRDAWTARMVTELLESHAGSDRPFMVFSGFWGPHFPYAVPAPYDTMYDPADVARWGNFDEPFTNKPLIQQKELLRWNCSHLTWPDWQKVIATYWGYCTFIDDQIRKILDCLKATHLADNTIIIYSTDHGAMLGSHRLFNLGMHMYDETYHIPLVVSWPGVTRRASVCDSFVSLVDLMPTILEMGGAQVPREIDGRSLGGFLRGDAVEGWPDDVYAEFHGYESALCTSRMVRTKSWKYIYNPCSHDELYDMASDPFELNNVANQLAYKHVLRRMKDRLVRWLRRTDDTIVQEDSWKTNAYDLYVSKREQ